MQEQIESWPLRSGTWYRDVMSESWRLATTPNGTVANAKLPVQDVGRMIGAKRDASSGQWFPSDFGYSPQTGAPLRVTITSLDSTWVPPFGASALSDLAGPPLARAARQTPAPLTLASSGRRLHPSGEADRMLPALPPGRYRFLVHKFDVASPGLMALEPRQGHLLVLLPESKTWMPLERPGGAVLAPSPYNSRGWCMELVEARHRATLYLPTANGLAAVTPTLIGLSYAVAYFGERSALGGPVAWAGEVWLPVRGTGGEVALLGKPGGAAASLVLPTAAPVPKLGFEAPVFDPLQVIWPSQEGQLVLRLDQHGRKETDWIAWPDGSRPLFSLGCPYLSPSGTFWQLCRRGQDEPFEYVQLGRRHPPRAAVDAPRWSTGRISYMKDQRIEGDPWRTPPPGLDGASTQVVVPLIESEFDGVVIGLRIDAPRGFLSLLESGRDRHRAVLQLHEVKRTEVPFGTISVTRPWLASLFIYDGHLWVHHPELPQPLGWQLER